MKRSRSSSEDRISPDRGRDYRDRHADRDRYKRRSGGASSGMGVRRARSPYSPPPPMRSSRYGSSGISSPLPSSHHPPLPPHHPPSPRDSRRDSAMSGSSSSSSRLYNYKVLCVSALHPKASDDVVKDTLYREYKRFGDLSIRISHEIDERVAYVCFRNHEDAQEAKRSKPRILLFDKVAIVEPVYEAPPRSSDYYRSSRRSSLSPPDYDHHHHRSLYRGNGAGGLDGRGSGSSSGLDRGSGTLSPLGHLDPRLLRYDRFYAAGGHAGAGLGSLRDYHRLLPAAAAAAAHHDFLARPPFHGMPHLPPGVSPHFYAPRHLLHPVLRTHLLDKNAAAAAEKKDKFPNYMEHKPPEDDPLATRTLFAGNLETNITEEELKRIFGQHGVVEDIDIKRPPPGTGNAYAFVRYETLDMAHRAKIELSGQYIGKFQCKIGYGKSTPTTRVWVGGLGPWTSITQLEREFDRFGAIKTIEYTKGDSQAFISFESVEAAEAAQKGMRGFPLGGPDKKLRTDFADAPGFTQPSSSSSSKPKHHHHSAAQAPPHFYDDPAFAAAAAYLDPWMVPVIDPYAGKSIRRGPYERKAMSRPSAYPSRSGESSDKKSSKDLTSSSSSDNNHHAHRRSPRSPRSPRSRSPRSRSPRSPRSPIRSAAARSKSRSRSMSPTSRRAKKTRSRSPGRSTSRTRTFRTRTRTRTRSRSLSNGEIRDDSDVDEKTRRASQLKSCRTLGEVSRRCISMSSTMAHSIWHGALILKKTQFNSKCHLLEGDATIAETLMKDEHGKAQLRITQRLHLDEQKLDDVQKRLGASSHAIFLGLAGSPITSTHVTVSAPTVTITPPAVQLVQQAIETQPEASIVVKMELDESAASQNGIDGSATVDKNGQPNGDSESVAAGISSTDESVKEKERSLNDSNNESAVATATSNMAEESTATAASASVPALAPDNDNNASVTANGATATADQGKGAVVTATAQIAASIDDPSIQTRPIRNLVSYLKQKEAAGVISLQNKHSDETGVLYAFPPCPFSASLLKRSCPSLTEDGLKDDHLVVVVVRGGTA